MTNRVIKLIKLNDEYKNSNLYLGCLGIVLEEKDDLINALFINENIIGDYAIVNVNKNDVEDQLLEIPQNFLDMLGAKEKLNENSFKNKTKFNSQTFNEGDCVKLMVDKERYNLKNVYKGDVGVIADNHFVKNETLVDFTKTDDDGNCFGDCISVNIKDLEKLF